MHRLYLLRHAKSSWELAGELDFERSLLPRGHDDLKLIEAYMREHDIQPDFVICSSARRAQETFAGVATALPKDVEIEITDEAYDVPSEKLLALVNEVKPEVESVLLIGHNPAIHDLAVDLAASGENLERIAAKYPTAALAELSFDGEWAKLGTDGARLEAFITPKELR